MGKTTKKFIEEARDIHGNKYDYSKVEYINNSTKVCIICPKHGEFWQIPKVHLRGHGCMKCAMEKDSENKTSNTEEFIKKAIAKHGKKYDYSKVEYINSSLKVLIKCKECGNVFSQTPNSHLRGGGCPFCRYKKARSKVHGIGIYDADIDYKLHKKSYLYWGRMIKRCYYKKEKFDISYKECSVCEEWLSFSNFEKWFDENYIEGYQLDKDILVKGNKVYSPNTCCFVPQEINTLFTKCDKSRGKYPIGVSKKDVSYMSEISKNHKKIYLGSFHTIEEAFNAYKTAKEEYIKELADKWKDKIEPRVYEAMYNYKVEITD